MKRARFLGLLYVSVALVLAKQAQAAASEAVTLQLRLAESRSRFRIGEVIPIVLKFAATDPAKYSIDLANYDRSGRMDIDTFQLSPKEGWSDPLAFYYESGLFSFMGGGIRSVPPLGPEGREISLDLNEWIRFDKPGRYKLSVSSDRVVKDRNVDKGKTGRSFGTHINLTSNEIDLDILPADEKWATLQVASAIGELSSPDHDIVLRGARRLRFLGAKDAATKMVEQFNRVDDGRDGQFEFGLLGSPHHQFIVDAMEKELKRADHPIDGSFAHLLAVLSYQVDHPEPLPELTTRKLAVDEATLKQIRQQMRERKEAFNPYITEVLVRLAASIPKRNGRALAQAYTAILREGAEVGSFDTPEFSGFLDELRRSLPTVFLSLPEDDQESLLTFWWSDLRCKAMLPVLMKKFNAAPKDFRRGELIHLIADLDPQRARELVREDLRAGSRSFSMIRVMTSEISRSPNLKIC